MNNPENKNWIYKTKSFQGLIASNISDQINNFIYDESNFYKIEIINISMTQKHDNNYYAAILLYKYMSY